MIARLCQCGEIVPGPEIAAHRQAHDRERWARQSRERGPRPYNTAKWRLLARHVRERDGHVCRQCASTRNLQAHHVDADPARFFDEANVVLLCSSCHRSAEHDRRSGITRNLERGDDAPILV